MSYICTRNRKGCMGIGPWCNGNTPVFGTVIQGSSPCGPTEKTPQIEEFFIAINLKKSDSFESDFFCLYFESNDWSFRVVY
jgi:hypothetical protein